MISWTSSSKICPPENWLVSWRYLTVASPKWVYNFAYVFQTQKTFPLFVEWGWALCFFFTVKRFQVHDSFWTHAGDVPMLNKSIRDWEGDSSGWSKAGLRSFIPFDGRDTKNVAEKWGWRWLATFRWCFNKVDSRIFVGAPNVPERNFVDEKFFLICEWFAAQNRKMFNKCTSHELRCFCSNIQSSIIQPLPDPMTFLSKSSQFSTKSRKPLWNSMRNLCCRTSMRPAGRYADVFVYFFWMCGWCTLQLISIKVGWIIGG